MYLFLADNEEIFELLSGIGCPDAKVRLLGSFDGEDAGEKTFLFTKTTLNFAGEKTLEFIKKQKNLSIIIISEKGERDDILVSWINSLCYDFGYKHIIAAKTVAEKIDERFIQGLIREPEAGDGSENLVTIYTDGACSGNPGAGGWGAVLMHGDRVKEISGYDPCTTNNKMELTAVIKALSTLKKRCTVELYSDSAYVVNAIHQGWLLNWKKNNWKNSEKEEVKNIELWQELDRLLTVHGVTFFKVKGHADNVYNNRCDELATGEIEKNRQ